MVSTAQIGNTTKTRVQNFNNEVVKRGLQNLKNKLNSVNITTGLKKFNTSEKQTFSLCSNRKRKKKKIKSRTSASVDAVNCIAISNEDINDVRVTDEVPTEAVISDPSLNEPWDDQRIRKPKVGYLVFLFNSVCV